MSRALAPEDQALIALARESLAHYVGIVHRTDDGTYAIPPAHLRELVIPAIEDDSLGHTLIVAPPGSIKTNTMVGACGWWLGRDPTSHVGYLCNTGPEAEKRSMAVRDIVEASGIYRAIFPTAKPNPKRGWKQDAWYLERKNLSDKNPSFLAAGVGGAIIGARLHRVVLDDIADEDNQRTELQRKQVWKWIAETVMTRLHPVTGRAIMICTRWHAGDPAAYAIDRGWHVVHIPAVREDAEGVKSSYWESYVPLRALECANDEHNPAGQCCIKRELGATGYARQYLGIVYNAETSRFQPNNWRRYQVPPETWDDGCITIDTAGWDNKTTTGDYAVCAAWVRSGKDYYCLEVRRGRWLFSEAERVAQELQARWELKIVVEDVPWARPLIDQLRKTTWGVIGWPVKGRSKVNRADAISPMHEAGDLWIPASAPWVQPFIEEHAAFPDGTNDDQVDTTSMAVDFLSRRRRPQRLSVPFKPWKRNYAQVRA